MVWCMQHGWMCQTFEKHPPGNSPLNNTDYNTTLGNSATFVDIDGDVCHQSVKELCLYFGYHREESIRDCVA